VTTFAFDWRDISTLVQKWRISENCCMLCYCLLSVVCSAKLVRRVVFFFSYPFVGIKGKLKQESRFNVHDIFFLEVFFFFYFFFLPHFSCVWLAIGCDFVCVRSFFF
jgi:hypothetical protein